MKGESRADCRVNIATVDTSPNCNWVLLVGCIDRNSSDTLQEPEANGIVAAVHLGVAGSDASLGFPALRPRCEALLEEVTVRGECGLVRHGEDQIVSAEISEQLGHEICTYRVCDIAWVK